MVDFSAVYSQCQLDIFNEIQSSIQWHILHRRRFPKINRKKWELPREEGKSREIRSQDIRLPKWFLRYQSIATPCCRVGCQKQVVHTSGGLLSFVQAQVAMGNLAKWRRYNEWDDNSLGGVIWKHSSRKLVWQKGCGSRTRSVYFPLSMPCMRFYFH